MHTHNAKNVKKLDKNVYNCKKMVAVSDIKKAQKDHGLILHSSISEIPDCPENFGKYAKNEWYEVWSFLTQYELATTIDLTIIIAYCTEVQIYKECLDTLKKEGMVTNNAAGTEIAHPCIAIKNTALKNIMDIAGDYGFTPAARLKVKSAKPKTTKSKLDLLIG